MIIHSKIHIFFVVATILLSSCRINSDEPVINFDKPSHSIVTQLETPHSIVTQLETPVTQLETPKPLPSVNNDPIQVVRNFYQAINNKNCDKALEIRPNYSKAACHKVHNIVIKKLELIEETAQEATLLLDLNYEKNKKPKYFSGLVILFKEGNHWIIKNKSFRSIQTLEQVLLNKPIDDSVETNSKEKKVEINSKEDETTQSTVPLCTKESFVVAIDIGHSIRRFGTTSAKGIGEFYFNKNLAKMLWKSLFQAGFTQAFLINEKGANITLKKRTAIAKRKNADLFIAIHHDSVQPRYLSSWRYKGKKRFYSDVFQGYSIFYSEKNRQVQRSLSFANLLGAEMRHNLFVPTLHHAEKIKGENRELVNKDKGIYRFDNLVVLKTATMPAVLLEAGLIVNRKEENLLSNPTYQKKLVLSVIAAIEKACRFWN
ncbi:N-acetylmuramoyl-L-alanine amidase [Candidatus Parabeggiatoa sp. HSG14]|uniref:N-acetylmuramoyl-L-alanine amidase family protein n=1 Tax=Candidatus Parabeggiatoa sp. HSG14 TaxID=3055593 RepID=UPI0025A729F2|nr:N-acetylmuramoyl-L-alanine amidase [Thiotrichales bacterium HSG14]